VRVAVPLAATEKLAALPEMTELELGCVVIVGATVTINVAALLVAEPALLVTTTV
jgi:hypothetical protein